MVRHQFPWQPEREYGLRVEYRIINQKAELHARLLEKGSLFIKSHPFQVEDDETTAASLQRGVFHAWEK
jgi:hypothetical protein